MIFRFREFEVKHADSPMKVGTDAVLLGALADLNGAETVLDVGAGCGVISLILAQRYQDVQIEGVEIDQLAALEAGHNFIRSPWSDRLKSHCSSFQDFSIHSDISFDHIVSNPPFFNNDLHSVYPSRTKSRHTVYLSHQDLIESIRQVSHGRTKLSLIIPASIFDQFDDLCMINGFYLRKKYAIRPKPGKAFNRVILEYGKEKCATQEVSLLIRNQDDRFSDEYRRIVSRLLFLDQL